MSEKYVMNQIEKRKNQAIKKAKRKSKKLRKLQKE